MSSNRRTLITVLEYRLESLRAVNKRENHGKQTLATHSYEKSNYISLPNVYRNGRKVQKRSVIDYYSVRKS